MRLLASSTPISSSSSLRSTRKAREVSVVVPDLETVSYTHLGRHAQGAAGQPALALSDDVGRRDEARHADVAAEEVVFDGMHVYFRCV